MMMNKIKKSVALIGALLMGSMGVACGGNTDTGENCLDVYCHKAGYGVTWCEDLLKEFVNQDWVKAKYEGVTYTFQSTDQDGYTKSKLEATNNNHFDLLFGFNGDKPADESLLEDLTQGVYKQKVPGEEITYEEKVFSSYNEVNKYIDVSNLDAANKYYTTSWAGGMNGIFYNEDLLEDLGYSVPRTTDELLAICNKIYENRTDGTANTSGAPGENTEDEGDACSLLISYVDMTAGSVDNPTALTATGSYTAPLQQTNGIATSDYWYAFTPSETGTYFIGNKINSDATYGLYAQSHIYADRYANSMEFTDQDYNYLECDLTAGTTYYLKVCSFNNVTQNLSFTIEKITKVYDGTQLRPYLASVGEMQTTVAAGTEIAVEIYYVYTATANGTVTIELPAAATDTAACLKIYKNDTSIDVINHGFYETETQDPDTSCALPVQTGDVITIVVSRITKDTSSDAAIYPDGTVTWTLAFSAAL